MRDMYIDKSINKQGVVMAQLIHHLIILNFADSGFHECYLIIVPVQIGMLFCSISPMNSLTPSGPYRSLSFT